MLLFRSLNIWSDLQPKTMSPLIKKMITENECLIRKPLPEDAPAIYQLIKRSPPLDLNSEYSYYLLTSHFYNTSVVIEYKNEIVGFLSAYFQQTDPTKLFVWQVAVDQSMRGKSLASMMLNSLTARPECDLVQELCATVNPSNRASKALFTKFSESIGSSIEFSEFIPADGFSEPGHEAEELMTIRLVNSTSQEKSYANI